MLELDINQSMWYFNYKTIWGIFPNKTITTILQSPSVTQCITLHSIIIILLCYSEWKYSVILFKKKNSITNLIEPLFINILIPFYMFYGATVGTRAA